MLAHAHEHVHTCRATLTTTLKSSRFLNWERCSCSFGSMGWFLILEYLRKAQNFSSPYSWPAVGETTGCMSDSVHFFFLHYTRDIACPWFVVHLFQTHTSGIEVTICICRLLTLQRDKFPKSNLPKKKLQNNCCIEHSPQLHTATSALIQLQFTTISFFPMSRKSLKWSKSRSSRFFVQYPLIIIRTSLLSDFSLCAAWYMRVGLRTSMHVRSSYLSTSCLAEDQAPDKNAQGQ